MSIAYTLARERPPLHEPIDAHAQWWRLWLRGRELPGENYTVLMQIDNIDSPQVLTLTFNDGLDETITVEAHRTGHSDPHRVSFKRPRYYSLIQGDPYLDLLTAGQPTDSPLWYKLTEPGHHRHPDDARMRMDLR